jgi:hypothetical protein
MWPIGFVKCKSCGGDSYFSEDGISDDEEDKFWGVSQECECFVGFAGLKDDYKEYMRDIPEGVLIIYREMSDVDYAKS